MVQPFECPICHGAGTVQRPPWIAGDQETWVSGSCGPFQCQGCCGTGIIWWDGQRQIFIDANGGISK